jgi:putative NADH-flavin reductase
VKVLIFGASGRTGSKAVELALIAGHIVTAVTHRPNEFLLSHDHLKVVNGDIAEAASIKPLFDGQDAVLSTVGIRGNVEGLKPTVVYSEGIHNILTAMKYHGVQRLICIAASGTKTGFEKEQPALATRLKNIYDDMKRMESTVMLSDVEWTIVRPHFIAEYEEMQRMVEMSKQSNMGAMPELPPSAAVKKHAGQYRVTEGYVLENGLRISPADLADFMVNQLQDRIYIRKGVAIAY